jgi:hypothetical protein
MSATAAILIVLAMFADWLAFHLAVNRHGVSGWSWLCLIPGGGFYYLLRGPRARRP